MQTDYHSLSDKVERMRRQGDVIVIGIPLIGVEKFNELLEYVYKIACVTGCTIGVNDLELVRIISSRENGGNTQRRLLVRFSNVVVRRDFFVRYMAVKSGLRTSCLGRSDNERVYVSDNLTGRNAAIRRRAITMVRDGLIKKQIIRKGLVLAVLNGETALRPIHSIEEV